MEEGEERRRREGKRREEEIGERGWRIGEGE